MMVEFDVKKLTQTQNDTEIKSTRYEKTFKGFISQRFYWSQKIRQKNVINMENPPNVLLSSHTNCMIATKKKVLSVLR